MGWLRIESFLSGVEESLALVALEYSCNFQRECFLLFTDLDGLHRRDVSTQLTKEKEAPIRLCTCGKCISKTVFDRWTPPPPQQALLNKRRLRCKGPPFLRLLETMQFVEQMLSAVSHLLAHGIAHNDIKPGRRQRRAPKAHHRCGRHRTPRCPNVSAVSFIFSSHVFVSASRRVRCGRPKAGAL